MRKSLITYWGVGICMLAACKTTTKQAPQEELETASPSELSISYKVPGDLASPDATIEELATFAWNEFFALNWRAEWAAQASSPASSRSRGLPDTSWDFATSGAAPDLAVWETYIHRTELRPADSNRYKVNLNTGKPDYTFIDPINTNGIELSDYWVNLDEDNEIGSCYLYAYSENQVLYMAKSNLTEYNYVRDKFPDDALLFKAVNNGQDLEYLKKVSQGQSCNSDTASNVVCLPCGEYGGQEGAIEIKTAWRKLTAADDPTRFFTRKAVYYTYMDKDGEATAQTDEFGLIGLHIIHKTKNYPAFVFASWEQVDVRQAQMQTIGQDVPQKIINGDTINDPNVDPHRPEPVIDREIPSEIQTVNAAAKALITSQNAASVWQYYQLIGVQGKPINYEDRATDPNYFMANYVIESDSTLTFFHGSFGIPFDESIQNVVYNGATYNMGGCQGCHGQAQLKGSDFSFLLDFGAGKPVDRPDPYLAFDVALDSVGYEPTQLIQMIKAYSKRN
ncbi:hypothetical protein [Marinoscillum furvescens]|uniref:Uncharacterized protein n=1 Tax=Marinoscillum furvescens DSM 4134 TaxID=1122208 RepID=A0A3D9L3E3_MARFU|nr:hypothetical protein [Marinoscillum furvescens]RED97891.1 hypothetical protein C7460_11132 [Marinoscillum furvescens DSM 4134]